MPFKKGHNHSGGRKKGVKNKQRLIQYKPKKWDTSFKNNSYNIDEITFRFENNLPIDDLIDTLANRYSKNKDGNKGV